MGTRRPCVLAAAAVLSFALLLTGTAACGGDGGAADAALGGTAAERAAKILGGEPTGVAKDVVERGYMVVANDRNYAPQSSIDATTGELVGFDVDVAKEVGAILGLDVRFENPEWEAVAAGLNRGRYDVSIGSMSITSEKDEVVDFTEPYYFASAQAFVKEGGPQIESVADLAGKKVGVGVATTYYDFLKKESKAVIKTYTTDADAFPDLRAGNVDFIVTAGPTGQEAILRGEPFAFSGRPLYYEDLAFAVAEGETDWVKLLEYAIAAMHEDGTLTDLSKEWYSDLDLTIGD